MTFFAVDDANVTHDTPVSAPIGGLTHRTGAAGELIPPIHASGKAALVHNAARLQHIRQRLS